MVGLMDLAYICGDKMADGTWCGKLELEATRVPTVCRLQPRLLKCRHELDVVVRV